MKVLFHKVLVIVIAAAMMVLMIVPAVQAEEEVFEEVLAELAGVEEESAEAVDISADDSLADDAELTDDAELAEDGELTDDAELYEDGELSDDAELAEDGELSDDAEPAEDGEFSDDVELSEDGELSDDAEPAEDGEFSDDAELAEGGELSDEEELAEDGDISDEEELAEDGEISGDGDLSEDAGQAGGETAAADADRDTGSDDAEPAEDEKTSADEDASENRKNTAEDAASDIEDISSAEGIPTDTDPEEAAGEQNEVPAAAAAADEEELVSLTEEIDAANAGFGPKEAPAPAETTAEADSSVSSGQELSAPKAETAADESAAATVAPAAVPAAAVSAGEQTEILEEEVFEEAEECEILSAAAPAEETEEFFTISEVFEDSAEGYEPVNMASEDLLEGYVMQQEEALYAGDYQGSKLSNLTEAVYNRLKALVIKIAAGSVSSTEFTTEFEQSDLSAYKWTAEDLGVSELFYKTEDGKNKINETAADNAINSIYTPALVVKALIRDCPYEMYWFGNKYALNKKYTPVVSYDKELEGYVLTIKNVTLTIKLNCSGDYADGDNVYKTNPTKVANAKKAALNAQKIVTAAEGKNDLDKLDYYRQAISRLVSYDKEVNTANYPGGYGDPWQMVYVFDGDSSTNVVCEGYAKAFQYLCDLSRFSTSDFAVYSVSGSFKTSTGGTTGGHLWNIVHMNGVNYMVDLTNSDDKTPTTKLFLVHPESGSVDSGYVFTAGSTTFTYKYSDDTRMLYTDEELAYDIKHEWDAGTIVAQPTCTTAGAKLYTCKLCNATKTETIPAKGHKEVVYSPAVEPTLFSTGKTVGTSCSVCRSIISAPQTISRQELTRELAVGMNGEDVKQVQQRLSDLGYSVYVDGDFGMATAAVVAKFQSEHGLYVDGSVGNLTLNALRTAASGSQGTDEPVLTRELSKGMTGSDVKVLQQKLASLGYSITVDGDFGNYTKSVVEAFQRDHGLYVDGVAGPKTLSVLNSLTQGSGDTPASSGDISLTRELKKGMTGTDVKAVQQKLSDLGYSIYVDGDFGAATDQIVKAFQKANGLYADGVVGNITVKTLNALSGGSGSQTSGKITLTRELSKGMNGQDVRAVQQKLSDLGYSIYVDGDFGAATESVVIAFQKANGLYADGVVGNITVNALNSR